MIGTSQIHNESKYRSMWGELETDRQADRQTKNLLEVKDKGELQKSQKMHIRFLKALVMFTAGFSTIIKTRRQSNGVLKRT